MRVREYKRILLADLPAHQAQGWRLDSEKTGGCIMVESFAGGTQQAVLVSRDPRLYEDAGEQTAQFIDVTGLGPDEVRVLERIAERLRMGARVYGQLGIRDDPRDWKKEGREELLDAAVYYAIASLKGQ